MCVLSKLGRGSPIIRFGKPTIMMYRRLSQHEANRASIMQHSTGSVEDAGARLPDPASLCICLSTLHRTKTVLVASQRGRYVVSLLSVRASSGCP